METPAAQAALREGLALARAGQAELAAAAFRRAVAAAPQWGAAHNNLGNALRMQGLLDDALAAYRAALDLAPEPTIARNVAATLLALERPAEAAEALQRVLELAPDDAESRQMLAMLTSPDGALAESASPAEPDLEAILDEGLAAHRARQFADAQRAYHFVLSRQPEHPRGLALLGVLGRDAGALADSQQLLERACRLDPDNGQWPLELANTLQAAQQLDQALAVLERLAAAQPQSAEVHNNRGGVLNRLGRHAEAEAAYRHAISLQPGLPLLWRNLAMVLLIQRQFAAAAEACQEYLRHVPDDPQMKYMRGFLTGERVAAMPPPMVASLFDDYAGGFDQHLAQLEYRVPEKLREAIGRLCPAAQGWTVVDLGCGTGLCGERFRSLAARLIGSDLSPKMIEAARARGVYDELRVEELRTTLASVPPADLIVAGDVLIYVGDLTDVFPQAAAALRPGGRLAFSTEVAAGDDYVILRSGRFSHSEAYIRRLAAAAGLETELCEAAALRMEEDAPANGQIFVLRKSAT